MTREIVVGRGGLAVEASLASLSAALSLAAASRRTLVWEGFRQRAGGFAESESRVVRLFQELSGGSVEGGEAGGSSLRFSLSPGELPAGARSLEVELAGREPLLTLLGALALPVARAGAGVDVVLRGSTHAPASASFEVAVSTWRHLVREAGIDVELELELAGFAPRGGGAVRLSATGAREILAPLALDSRSELRAVRVVSAAARLPAHVQQRQAARARSGIQVVGLEPSVQLLKLRAANAGSVAAVTGVFGDVPVTVSAIPARGRSVESAGDEAAAEFRRLVSTGSLVPPPLVQPLLLVLAFAEGPSALSTWRLPPESSALVELSRAFTGRELAIEGKPGKPARLRLE